MIFRFSTDLTMEMHAPHPITKDLGGPLELSEIYGYTVYICIPSILQIKFGDNAYWGYKQ